MAGHDRHGALRLSRLRKRSFGRGGASNSFLNRSKRPGIDDIKDVYTPPQNLYDLIIHNEMLLLLRRFSHAKHTPDQHHPAS